MNKAERIQRDDVEELVEFYAADWHHGYMSNFSAHPVRMIDPFWGVIADYPTTEHRFQALKATNSEDHDNIRASVSPTEAKQMGRSIDLRVGWGNDYGDLCWYVMFEALLAKFIQHPEILNQLRATGDATIWEDSPVDDIWGIRYQNDYRGKNLLGRCLMDVREILR
jgi:ribA/ribD-fused uncharacterized protein